MWLFNMRTFNLVTFIRDGAINQVWVSVDSDVWITNQPIVDSEIDLVCLL